MKVLQILQRPQKRGAEIFAIQLSEELKHFNIECDILFLFDNKNQSLEINSPMHHLGGNQRIRFIDIKSYARLSRLINRENYDLVQANAGDTLKYAVLSKKIFGWKQSLIFRNANKLSAFLRDSFHRWFNKKLLQKTNYIISVSENCRNDILELYPGAINKSETITIGTYLPNKANIQLREQQNFVWINIGSFVPEKNHRFLIELFYQFKINNPKSELWLIGDGNERPKIESLCSGLNLNDSIKFLGVQDNILSLLPNADVMVMPSLIEGLPAVILEAMSCRVPVVASDVGGIPEVITNGFNGFAVNGFKTEDYLESINALYSDVELREKFIERSMELIKEKFEMKIIASQFARAYTQLYKTQNG